MNMQGKLLILTILYSLTGNLLNRVFKVKKKAMSLTIAFFILIGGSANAELEANLRLYKSSNGNYRVWINGFIHDDTVCQPTGVYTFTLFVDSNPIMTGSVQWDRMLISGQSGNTTKNTSSCYFSLIRYIEFTSDGDKNITFQVELNGTPVKSSELHITVGNSYGGCYGVFKGGVKAILYNVSGNHYCLSKNVDTNNPQETVLMMQISEALYNNIVSNLDCRQTEQARLSEGKGVNTVILRCY